MRLNRAPSLAIAIAVVVVTALAGCGGPQVIIELSASPDLLALPDFVRFAFPTAEGDTEEAGPFGLTSVPAEAFAANPPGVSFSVDVIGCLSNDRAECEDPGSFVARGCDGPFSRAREDTLEISIELLPAVDGNAACPVSP